MIILFTVAVPNRWMGKRMWFWPRWKNFPWRVQARHRRNFSSGTWRHLTIMTWTIMANSSIVSWNSSKNPFGNCAKIHQKDLLLYLTFKNIHSCHDVISVNYKSISYSFPCYMKIYLDMQNCFKMFWDKRMPLIRIDWQHDKIVLYSFMTV